jgi:creatinine amidohydrolase
MQLAEMTWSAVDRLDRKTPVVIPIAALEQHGDHLPVFTDSMLCGEIIRRVAIRYADVALFAPLQWLGNSDHHLDFTGTLSAPPRLYIDLLNASIDNFVMHGFKRLVFINGHGGNDTPGKQAIFEARQRYRTRDDLLFLFGTYWHLGADPNSIDESLQQRQMGHACEWETSMILRIAPHLVGNLDRLEDVPFGNPFEPAHRGWITKDRTIRGHIGQPRFATAEKGETLFTVFTDAVGKLLDRVLAWDGRSWNG